MKIALIVVRTLLGLLFLFASVAYFLMTPPPMEDGPLKTFTEGLGASGYFMTLLKVTEFVCSLMLLSGRFVPLALVILAPIAVNIFMVHLILERSGLPVAIFVVAAMIFLAYCYRDAFKPLLTSKYTTS